MMNLKIRLTTILVLFSITACINANEDQIIVNEYNITCDIRDTINITDGVRIDNDRIEYNGLIYEKEMYDEFDFIYKNYSYKINVEPHLRGCVCELKKCIRVCRFCDDDEDTKGTCVKTSILTVPTEDNEIEEISLDNLNSKYAVVEGKRCEKMIMLEAEIYDEDKWSFKDGDVLTIDGPFDHKEICFNQNKTKYGNYSTIALKCTSPEDFDPQDEKEIIRSLLFRVCMMISIPFLLATLFIYGFIPELRNLHGKCLMCYIVSLLLFYLGLIIVNCEVTFNAHEPSCIVFGYFVLIGVQFCFFWLNVMCYDLWSAFKVGMTSRGSDKKRFLFYCLYAFGVPILFIFIVYIIDSTEFIPKDYRPEIGLFRCYIKTSTLAESIYVYIPISIILLINIALYSITAMTIYRVQKETAVIRRGDSQTHSKMESDRNKFTLYLRLFVLMGVTWTMEAISFYLGKDHEAVFYITDILNCIQGVIIFFMFVWKPKIKKLIVRRYRQIRNLPSSTNNSKSSEASKLSSVTTTTISYDGSKLSQGEQPIIDKTTSF